MIPGGWCISCISASPSPSQTNHSPMENASSRTAHCPLPTAHSYTPTPPFTQFRTHTPPAPPTPHVCAGAKTQDQSAARWLRLICAKPLRPPVLGWPLSDVNFESGPDSTPPDGWTTASCGGCGLGIASLGCCVCSYLRRHDSVHSRFLRSVECGVWSRGKPCQLDRQKGWG